MRRCLATVGVGVSLLLVAGIAPVSATELDEYLEEAAVAEYSGQRIIITMWDGESRAGIFKVAHVSEMTVIGGSDGSLVGPGKVSDGAEAAVMVPVWSRYSVNDRYTTGDPVTTVRLGRSAEMIEVMEAGRVRARFVFDALTKVPLATEIYDGGGRLFRYSAMIEFDPKPGISYAAMEAMGDSYEVMFPVEVASLPHDAGGYIRADTYAGPDETIQAFYSDGLFSFSLFEIDSGARLDRFEDAARIEVGGATYGRLITPTEIWVSWETDDATYVLVGDLPPDHLEEVLADLPRPDQRNLLSRLWRGIFG
jgi:hypothetical protein